VLLAAGGDVRKPDGSAISYGEGYSKGHYIVPAFIASGERAA
jgi:3'-phosphoadenosine 5'-phosphosulfate (PAPS) 3'-phosphatase